MMSDEQVRMLELRDAWEARCHFCNGPSFPWMADDATWAEVSPLLGQQQACFECFMAARQALGILGGEPMHIRRHIDAASEPNGVSLIADERKRQIEAEGWTADHDDMHEDDDMARAAACYAIPASRRKMIDGVRTPSFDELMTTRGAGSERIHHPVGWPWDSCYWKPSPDNRIRELVKAGALIAAEIDRLARLASQSQQNCNTSAGRVTPSETTWGVNDLPHEYS